MLPEHTNDTTEHEILLSKDDAQLRIALSEENARLCEDLRTAHGVGRREAEKFAIADAEIARLQNDIQRIQRKLLAGITEDKKPDESISPSVEMAIGMAAVSLAFSNTIPLTRDRVGLQLISVDQTRKIPAIKMLRTMCPGMGLKEAKDIIEGAPTTLGMNIPMETALQVITHMRQVGAIVEMK